MDPYDAQGRLVKPWSHNGLQKIKCCARERQNVILEVPE